MSAIELAKIIAEVMGILVTVCGGVVAAVKYYRAWRTKDEAAKLDAANAIAAAKTAVIAALPELVTQAEKTFGSGTGAVKLASVAAQAQMMAANLLPDSLKTALPADWIAARVDEAIAVVKKLWERKPGLVGAAPEESE